MKNYITKYVTLILIGAVLLVLAGCSGDKVADIDVSSVLTEQIKLMDEGVVELTEDVIYSFYDIKSEDIDEIKSAKSGDGMTADEVTIIKAKEANIEKVKEALKLRKDMIYEAFVEYNPDEKEKIENAIIEQKGNYILFVVSDKSEEIKTAFLNSFSK